MSTVYRINKYLKKILEILKDQANSGGMVKASREIFENNEMLAIHMGSLGEALERWDRAFITETGIVHQGWDTTLAAELERQGISVELYPSLVAKAIDGTDDEQGIRNQLDDAKRNASLRRGSIYAEMVFLARELSLLLQLSDSLADLTRDHTQLHNPVHRMEKKNSMAIMLEEVIEYITNPENWGRGFNPSIIDGGRTGANANIDDRPI